VRTEKIAKKKATKHVFFVVISPGALKDSNISVTIMTLRRIKNQLPLLRDVLAAMYDQKPLLIRQRGGQQHEIRGHHIVHDIIT
jgi:hypothetical protein